jgi:predicted RNA-binding Zn ribbon-like protein
MVRKNEPEVSPETIALWGGALCLDFVNSVDWTADHQPLSPRTDALAAPHGLARWGRRLGVLSARSPLAAPGEPLAALALRTALEAIFTAARRPPAGALRALEQAAAEAAAAARLERDGPAWRQRWPRDDVRAVRWAVAADAVALLADATRLQRVSRCPGLDCGWFFLDVGGHRRWCSMRTCGSRAKMRRLYARRRRG